jgi:hypothetical protein
MTYPLIKVLSPIVASLCVLGLTTPVLAQENTAGLSIELSAAEEQDGTCLMSFVAQNNHPQDIDSAVFETVLFGESGQVARMTLLDFEQLPAGRLRVRQFRFDGMSCTAISRILINGAETCTGTDLNANACTDDLKLITRVKTELIG